MAARMGSPLALKSNSSSQVELPHGLRKDDTVLNRVQLHCCHGEVLYRGHPAKQQMRS